MKTKSYIRHHQQQLQEIPKTPKLTSEQRARPTCKLCYQKDHTKRKCLLSEEDIENMDEG